MSEQKFQQRLGAMQQDIDTRKRNILFDEKSIETWMDTEERRQIERELPNKKEQVNVLTRFRQDHLTHWSNEDSRILGQVLFSPPIALGVGAKQYTQDLAVLAIDASKIDPLQFAGNVINLRHEFTPAMLDDMMNPNPNVPTVFTCPQDYLLKLQGTIPDSEMQQPTMLDQYGQPCIMVLKRGPKTGLTVGCANNTVSYMRRPHHSLQGVSKEWAILPFNQGSGAFSGRGDSGSVVVDGRGRIGGILTGGAPGHQEGDPPVTYVTPISSILEVIRGYEPLAGACLREV